MKCCKIGLYTLHISTLHMELSLATQETRRRYGTNLITLMWSDIVDKVVEAAVRVYELTPEQGDALRKAFQRVQYVIEET